MSKNVVTPKSVSFEDALRNLASRLTGQPVAKLPRTQEGVVQFMAENVPSLDELAESITMEVFARLVKTEAENPGSVVQQEDPDKAAQEAHDAPGTSGGTSTPGEAEEPNTEAPVADGKPKRGSKAKTQK
jgi:hypothetical protein